MPDELVTGEGSHEPEDEQKPERKAWSENYTLARVQAHRPQDVKRAAELLAQNIPKDEIQRTCKMHFYTVAEIERQLLPEIAQRREYAANKAFTALTASLDSATARAYAGKATAVDAKLLSDTYLSLSGEAINVVDVNHHFPQLQDFNAGNGPIVEV